MDIVSVMTIDYGYAIGPPAPIAPVWWVEEMLMYATGQINRRKVMMAMSLYGYDWAMPTQQPAEMIPVLNAQNRAISGWLPIQYDQTAQAPTYSYNLLDKEHIVWFEDIESMKAKYKQMQAYDLLGATYWRLRFPFPQNWAYVEKNMRVIKG